MIATVTYTKSVNSRPDSNSIKNAIIPIACCVIGTAVKRIKSHQSLPQIWIHTIQSQHRAAAGDGVLVNIGDAYRIIPDVDWLHIADREGGICSIWQIYAVFDPLICHRVRIGNPHCKIYGVADIVRRAAWLGGD